MALNREGADTAIKVTRLCSESGRGRALAGRRATGLLAKRASLPVFILKVEPRLIPATAEQQTSADLI